MNHRHTNPLIAGMGLLAALALLSGCGGNQTNLMRWVAQIKARPGAPLPPLPVIRTPKSFAYDNALADPFIPPRPPITAKPANGVPSPDPSRPRQHLEHYSLKELAMVGTLHGPARRAALIRTPDGIIHIVVAGQYLGKHDGKVMAVHADAVAIEEVIPDGNGGWRGRQAAMQMITSQGRTGQQ